MGQYISIKDFCKRLKITKMTYYSWVKEGLPYLKFGKLVRLEEVEVMKWVQEHKICE